MTYTITLERGDLNHPELDPLYRQHYSEMQARLKADGVPIGDYNPDFKGYYEAFKGGWLINYVVRHDGVVVGYANVYLTNDMHNGDLIAQEDTVYIVPGHRNGIGRKLVKHILKDLGPRGVLRLQITPITDLRVAKIWARMGFREVSTQMIYTFKENN